jgi:hypothetical protein
VRDGVLRGVAHVADGRHRQELAVEVHEDRVVEAVRVRDHPVEEEPHRRGVVRVEPRGHAGAELRVLVGPPHAVVVHVGERVGDRVAEVVGPVAVRVVERLAGVPAAVPVRVHERLRRRVVVREGRGRRPVEVHARAEHRRDVVALGGGPGGHPTRVDVRPRGRVGARARLVRVGRVALVAAVAGRRDPVGAELEPGVPRLEVGEGRVDERLDRVHEDPPAGDVLEREQVHVVDLRRRVGVADGADDGGHLRDLRARERLAREVAEHPHGADPEVARVDAGKAAHGDPPVPPPAAAVGDVARERVVGGDERPGRRRVGGDRQRRVLGHAVVEAVEVRGDLPRPALDVRPELREDRERLVAREHPVARGVRVLDGAHDVRGPRHGGDRDDGSADQALEEGEAARPGAAPVASGRRCRGAHAAS